VSNVPPGNYFLAGRMDPDNHIKEKDENNGYGFSAAPVRVPGYRAQAVATTTGFRTAKTFSLASQSFAPTVPIGPNGAPSGYAGLGTLRYRIESLPARGVLRNGTTVITAGTTLPAGVTQLSYTPNTTFSGVDTFAFSAVNYVGGSPSRYPLQPAQATATVNVGGSGIAVGVSGVPGQMVVGTQAQLSVTTTGSGATWTVDGVPGGNATVGTITPGGLYTAPAAIPPAGKVTIQAVSTDDEGARSAPVEVAIVAATVPEPRPIIEGSLKKPGVLAVGRNVTVSMQLPRSGRLTVGLYRGSVRLGGCVINAPGAQTATCKIRMRKPYDPGTLRIRTAFAYGSTVIRGNVSAGGSSFSRVSVARRGARVVLSVVPKRPGLVRVAITRRGAVVAQCSSRVLAGRALTCSRRVAPGTLGVSVTLRDNQGRLVVRELTRR
jgi:hypothetical protein